VQKLDVLLGDLQGTTVEFTRHMGALDQVGRGAQAIGDASTALQATLVDDTLPRLSQAADDLSRTSRTLDRFLSQMQERPQSLVLGAPAPAPGPGEAGFATPAGERQ
jgi:phospholipid/cholesterol/gamma-HCH transport system substrate-binding protein